MVLERISEYGGRVREREAKVFIGVNAPGEMMISSPYGTV